MLVTSKFIKVPAEFLISTSFKRLRRLCYVHKLDVLSRFGNLKPQGNQNYLSFVRALRAVAMVVPRDFYTIALPGSGSRTTEVDVDQQFYSNLFLTELAKLAPECLTGREREQYGEPLDAFRLCNNS